MARNTNRHSSTKHQRTGAAPASGERAAVGGYRDQYHLQAEIVYRHLSDGSLERLYLADRAAGHLDDFRFLGRGCCDAYQIKSGRFQQALTFAAFTRGSSGAPAPIRQLADGWVRLSELHPGCRVVVHWIDADIPSAHDKVVDSQAGSGGSFAAFLEEQWRPTRESRTIPTEIQSKWADAWKRLKDASGLSDQEFEQFVKDCDLEFGARIRGEGSRLTSTAAAADIAQIREKLFDAVADPQEVVECSVEELLGRLGWTHRLSFHSLHSLPVDRFYRPIVTTVDTLRSRLDELPGGYLSLVGPPGAGKSTLLTDALRYLPQTRAVPYYAYVPPSHAATLSSTRGEAKSFLHDLIVSFRAHGVGGGLPAEDRNDLISQLQRCMELAHEEYRNSGRKTVILVDGLDHIERELVSERTLMADLPAPSDVPDGVYFLLGTQTLNLVSLPAAVVQQLGSDDRTIAIDSLSPAAAGNVIDAHDLPDKLAPLDREAMIAAAAGHPLLLRYVLARVKGGVSVAQAVAEMPAAAGDVTAYYDRIWRRISGEGESETLRLLVMLSRSRRPAALQWIKLWAPDAALARLKSEAGHVLREDQFERWSFFHNSFRQYVLAATSRDFRGQHDEQIDRRWYHLLAEAASQSGARLDQWDELWYRYTARDEAECLTLCERSRLLRQAQDHRPLLEIIRDLQYALVSACHLRRPSEVVRLLLLLWEYDQREDEQHDDPSELLFAGGHWELALRHAGEEGPFPNSGVGDLHLSRLLLRHGFDTEAARLFDQAEPREYFNGLEVPDIVHGMPELQTWAELAVYFRTIDEVLDCIRTVQRSERTWGTEAGLKSDLLSTSGYQLMYLERWDDLFKLLEEFDLSDDRALGTWFWLVRDSANHASRAGQLEVADRFLSELRARDAATNRFPQFTVEVATLEFRLHNDAGAARALLAGVPQPAPISYPRHGENASPYQQRLRLNRLLTALGSPLDLFDVVADNPEVEDWITNLERQVVAIARLWGRAWRGDLLHPSQVNQETVGIRRAIVRDATRGFHDVDELHPFSSPPFGVFYCARGRMGVGKVNRCQVKSSRTFIASWLSFLS